MICLQILQPRFISQISQILLKIYSKLSLMIIQVMERFHDLFHFLIMLLALQKQLMEQLKEFIHGSQFWKWHGFVLSILWLFGSSIGILVKKKSILAHLLTFFVVDYVSLFFMGTAFYLLVSQPLHFSEWNVLKKAHVLSGILILGLLIYQHVSGAIAWHKSQSNCNHRKWGPKLALLARISAGVGWLISEQKKIIAGFVFISAVMLYLMVQKKHWGKIKVA